MAIRVFIKRHMKTGKIDEALELLKTFRRHAMAQPGYISGETLINHYDRRSITVVSTWARIDDWVRWQESEARAANEAELEKLLEEPTRFEIYDLGTLTPQND